MKDNSFGGFDGVEINCDRVIAVEEGSNKRLNVVVDNFDLCTFGTQLSAAQIVNLAGDQSTLREIIAIAQDGLDDSVFTAAEQACIDVFNAWVRPVEPLNALLKAWLIGEELAGAGKLS